MVNSHTTLRLLALPVSWMGGVQICFGLISMLWFKDQIAFLFLGPAILACFASLIITIALRRNAVENVTFRDALVFATLTWVISGLLGAIPIKLITGISFVDAVFEALSALTTTGATVLSGLDDMPKSFLMYRQFLQWMGGLGVVIFVVAVLPMLNVGGMRLLKAETPGPVKNEKLSPRIANTAHYLWFIYVLITVLCALAYYLAGMTAFDAIAHSFTTVSTGGFSTHDASMWFYQSHTLLNISVVFMLLGATSFMLHFRVLYKGGVKLYWQDEETRVFIFIVIILTLVLAFVLFRAERYDLFASVSFALFHVVSFITSTGFGAADLSSWPSMSAMFLIFCGYLGGCAGSTAGGNKIIRDIITFKLMRREFRQLMHPQAVLSVRFQRKPLDSDVVHAVMGFMSIAALTSFVFTLLLMATGLDFWSSFSAVAACVNVLGPGFGAVGSNFEPVSDLGISFLSVAMLLGRLEYFTVLTLLLPSFWRY